MNNLIYIGPEYTKVFRKAKEMKHAKKYFKYFCRNCSKELFSTRSLKKIDCKFCGHRAYNINKDSILKNG